MKEYIDKDGFSVTEYDEEDMRRLRVKFKGRYGCSPEEFLERYDHWEHPAAPGLTSCETHRVIFDAKFLIKE